MIVTACIVADFEQFLHTFETKGVEKRCEYGCRGARLYRDPRDHTCIWAIFDWDREDYERFLADPAIPSIARELGLQTTPFHPELLARFEN